MAYRAAVCLASRSPRRRELLQQVGVDFDVVDVTVDESALPGESPQQRVCRLALAKARAGVEASNGEPRPVIGADTLVVCDERVLGKPAGRADGIGMLKSLSGRTHCVLSAVAVVAEQATVELSSSDVTFRTLSDAECAAYWDTGEPADKAGAYAIQGYAAMFIEELRGSYSGVMGLPLHETCRMLAAVGISLMEPGRKQGQAWYE